MSRKVIIELTSEEYNMLIVLLNQILGLKGTGVEHYAKKLRDIIERKSKIKE